MSNSCQLGMGLNSSRDVFDQEIGNKIFLGSNSSKTLLYFSELAKIRPKKMNEVEQAFFLKKNASSFFM
jgi:hypothetical protein